MGLLDDMMAMAGGGNAAQGQNTGGLGAILAFLNSPQVGGISGLQNMMQQGGLGHIVSSWLSNGQNMPVSAEQLQNVLHSGALQQAAQSAGIDVTQLTGLMSSVLPGLVDKLTPNGQIPEGNALSQMMKGLGAGA